MKGFTPLVLGIFATLAFSWLGLAYIPDLQIGHLDPQSDEEGTDIYPMPKSGMAERGRRIYVANGCFYCHSERSAPIMLLPISIARATALQVRPQNGVIVAAHRAITFSIGQRCSVKCEWARIWPTSAKLPRSRKKPRHHSQAQR